MARGRLPSAYWRLWTAAAVSAVGDGVDRAALPLLALTVTRDPRRIAVVTMAAGLPWLLFALVAGAYVDRVDRRRLMVWTDVLRGVLVGTVAITVATDHVTIPLLAMMAFGLGTGDTLFRTASLALVPRVVPDEHLEAAEGFHSAGETVAAQFVGPPVGGVLFAVAASLPFFIDSVSFGLSVLLLLSLPGTFRAERRQLDTAAHRSLIGEIGEGLRWLWAQPVLRTLALTLGVWNLVASGGEAVLVLFAADDLGVKGAGFGVLLATAAVGSVIGGVVAGRISRRVRSGTLLRAAVLGGALAQLSFGFSPNVVFAGVLFAVVGFVGVVWNVVTIALRQRLVPDALMGRVNGAYRLVGIGTSPIGALAGGFLAHAVGVRWVFYAGGLALAMAGLVASPWLANGAFPTPEPSP